MINDPKFAALTPALPATSQEFINLIAHYYRGEIARMAGWRDRIDRTTNWAITCVAAMLSIAWAGPGHHEILLFAMVIVLLLLVIESRRYRFFDVYRRRVRAIEHHYYAQVFSRTPTPAVDWALVLGEDLRFPTFAVTQLDAFCRRLRRNYIWLFVILLVAWVLQITGADRGIQATPNKVEDILSRASIGALPGGAVVMAVGFFYIILLALALAGKRRDGELVQGQVHV